jgi:hypothetical protein
LDGVGGILDLLGHGDSCNRRSNDIRSGLAAGFREKVLADVSNAGERGKFNATVEGKFGEVDVFGSILKQENKKARGLLVDSIKLLGDQVKNSDPNRTARPIRPRALVGRPGRCGRYLDQM